MSHSLIADEILHMNQASLLQDVAMDTSFMDNSLTNDGTLTSFTDSFSGLPHTSISAVGPAAIDPGLLHPVQDITSPADLDFSLPNNTSFQRPTLPSHIKPANDIGHKPVAIRNEPWISKAISANSYPNIESFQPSFHPHANSSHPADSGYAGSVGSNRRTISSTPAQPRKRSLQTESHASFMNNALPDQPSIMPESAKTRSRAPSSIAASDDLPDSAPRSCPACGTRFTTNSESTKHMARHRREFKCEERDCKKSDGFATRNDLDRHLRTVHDKGDIDTEVWRCLVSGCKSSNKNWPRQDNFRAHIMRMHKEYSPDRCVKESHEWFERVEKPRRLREQRGETLPASATSHSQSPHGGSSTNLSPVPPLTSRHSVAGEPSYANMDVYSQMDQMGLNLPHHMQAFTNQMTMTPWTPYATSTSVQVGSNSINPFSNNMLSTTGSYGLHNSDIPRIQTEFVSGSLGPPYQSRLAEYDTRTAPDPINYQNIVQSPIGDQNRFYLDESSSQQTGLLSYMGQSMNYSAKQITDGLNTTMDDLPQQSPTVAGGSLAISPRTLNGEGDTSLQELLSKLSSDPALFSKVSKLVQNHHSSGTGFTLRDGPIPGEAPNPGDPTSTKEEKVHHCSQKGCDKSFSQKNVCVKHEKRHARSWFCTFDGCDKRSGSKQDMQRHENKRHTQESGWRCWCKAGSRAVRPDCAEFFTDHNQFEKHCKDVHKGYPKRSLSEFKVERDFTGNFWCGFCNAVVENPTAGGINGSARVKYRYNHIDKHLSEGKTTADWYNLKGNGKTKYEVNGLNNNEDDDIDVADDDDTDAAAVTITPSTTSVSSGTKRKRSGTGPVPSTTHNNLLAPPPSFQHSQRRGFPPPAINAFPPASHGQRHARTMQGIQYPYTMPNVRRAAALRRPTLQSTGDVNATMLASTSMTSSSAQQQQQHHYKYHEPHQPSSNDLFRCCQCMNISSLSANGARCGNSHCNGHEFCATCQLPSGF